jgi:DNA topoisomerase IA
MTTPQAPSAYYVGKIVKAVAARYDSKMTEPPKRYTEDTLIADMLAAHKFAANEQERQILKETEGLGTSRTRASTIDGLIKGGFLESKKKKKLFELRSTDMARMTIQHLPDLLTSVATTAKWEVAFKMIERGNAQSSQVKQALKVNLDFIVKAAKDTGSIKVPGASGPAGGAPKRFPAAKPTPATASARFSQASQGAQAKPAPAAAVTPKVNGAASGASKGISSWFR